MQSLVSNSLVWLLPFVAAAITIAISRMWVKVISFLVYEFLILGLAMTDDAAFVRLVIGSMCVLNALLLIQFLALRGRNEIIAYSKLTQVLILLIPPLVVIIETAVFL